MGQNTQNNQLFTGDCLHVMVGMNSESVDLIYLDPPFNSKRTYSAPVGSKSAGASFKDMWTWEDVDELHLEHMISDYPYLVQYISAVEVIHGKAMMAYLTYMAQRILEMHRLLKPTGSLYLHCDPTASHYLKVVLDRLFGAKHFRNELVWCYSQGGRSKSHFPRKHDVIFWYSKGKKWTFNGDDIKIPFELHSAKSQTSFTKIDENGRRYKEIYGTGKKKLYRYYEDEGKIPYDWWSDIHQMTGRTAASGNEYVSYPTQKPLALMHRIIKASSNEGDIVLDPFCGCATTCVAAQQLGRRWIGIDVEAKAAELVVDRLTDDAGIFKDFVHRNDVPQRTDVKIEAPNNKDVKERLYTTQKGVCNGCGNHYLKKDFHIDHIVPRSKGGGDYYENYQLLCGHCNSAKGDRPMAYLRDKIKKMKEHMRQRVTFGD